MICSVASAVFPLASTETRPLVPAYNTTPSSDTMLRLLRQACMEGIFEPVIVDGDTQLNRYGSPFVATISDVPSGQTATMSSAVVWRFTSGQA